MIDNADRPLPGTYILLLQSEQNSRLAVGRLGEFVTESGYYLYIGSAFGPGGVQARIKHHRKIASRPHWHIDYLRKACDLVDAWCVYEQRLEHDWARRLNDLVQFTEPLPGFGSSDCGCATHLYFASVQPTKQHLQTALDVELLSIAT